MTVKEWLRRGQEINKEIEMLKREREAAFTAASRVCASYGGEKVQTSPGNTTERKFLKCAEYIELIDRRINELYTVKNEILSAINKIGDTKLRRLLILRYVEFMTWENIADEMHYSLRAVYILHGQALKKAGEVIPLPNKT